MKAFALTPFVLTKRAKADLRAIAIFTEERWEKEQRNLYIKQFDDAFICSPMLHWQVKRAITYEMDTENFPKAAILFSIKKTTNKLAEKPQKHPAPFEGLGKPEPLKHTLAAYWSRRINDEHRIVYKVQDGSPLRADSFSSFNIAQSMPPSLGMLEIGAQYSWNSIGPMPSDGSAS